LACSFNIWRMIFDFVLNVVSFLLRSLGVVLPTYTVFPTSLAGNISTLMAYINGWSWIFPVSTLMSVFAVIVLLVFVEFVYFTTMYVFSLIHASIKG